LTRHCGLGILDTQLLPDRIIFFIERKLPVSYNFVISVQSIWLIA